MEYLFEYCNISRQQSFIFVTISLVDVIMKNLLYFYTTEIYNIFIKFQFAEE